MRSFQSSFFKGSYHFLIVFSIILSALVFVLVTPTPSLAASTSTKIALQTCKLGVNVSLPMSWNPPRYIGYRVGATCGSRMNRIIVTADILQYDVTLHKWAVQREDPRSCSGCSQLIALGLYRATVGGDYK